MDPGTMRFHYPTAELFVPDGTPEAGALARITHLGIGAHQDDLEFMAIHGILECFCQPGRSFGGITCGDGKGSPRSGSYARYTDEQMQAVRRQEQRAAAVIGRYGLMAQLDYPSRVIKDPADHTLREELERLLSVMHPQVVYTHNLADKHDTHVAVALTVVQALRELPATQRPSKVYGCEVWRDLDWVTDAEKVLLDVSGHENLAAALNGVFDSQITGGKRYDLATHGRRRANATFLESHATDQADQLCFAMDLTPLVADDRRDIIEYVTGFIERFEAEVKQKLARQLGPA